MTKVEKFRKKIIEKIFDEEYFNFLWFMVFLMVAGLKTVVSILKDNAGE